MKHTAKPPSRAPTSNTKADPMPLVAKNQQQPAKRAAPPSSRARGTDRPKRLGRPPKFNPEIGNEVCELIACGFSLRKASAALGIAHETVLRWAVRYPDFRHQYAQARALRVDWMTEEMLDIADDAASDWALDKEGNPKKVDREAVLRSRLGLETRKWLAARLDPKQWGERQQLDIHNDWSLLPLEERERRADEIIQMVKDIESMTYVPKPLEYRWREDENPAGGCGEPSEGPEKGEKP